jgi:hypothetical protein
LFLLGMTCSIYEVRFGSEADSLFAAPLGQDKKIASR